MTDKAIKRYTVSIPKELHQQVKIWCATNDVPMRDIVAQLLQQKVGYRQGKTKTAKADRSEARV